MVGPPELDALSSRPRSRVHSRPGRATLHTSTTTGRTGQISELRHRATLTGQFSRYPLGHLASTPLCCLELGLREGHEREIAAVKVLKSNAHLCRFTLIPIGNPRLDQRHPEL